MIKKVIAIIMLFSLAVSFESEYSVKAQNGFFTESEPAVTFSPEPAATPSLGPVATPSPEPVATSSPEPTSAASLPPVRTEKPKVTAKPKITAKPKHTKKPKPTAKPKPTPHVVPLKKVTGVELLRYSTNAVRVTWKKQRKAKYYRVYYSKRKKGGYHLAGMTKDTDYLVKRLKNKKTYRFYVQACKQKKKALSDSKPSKIRRMTMKKYRRKIIFAGDSICEGIGYGWAFPRMHSSAEKKTVAYRGLNTITFHTKRVFHGQTGLQRVISEKPYRVYMMLGLNEISYRTSEQILAEYKDLVKSIRLSCPKTDIVLCAISPVTRAENASHPGMSQIPGFNKKLSLMAKKLKMKYFDYTGFLKDSSGHLKAEYAAGDGYHWQSSAYVKFGTIVGKFEKSLEK